MNLSSERQPSGDVEIFFLFLHSRLCLATSEKSKNNSQFKRTKNQNAQREHEGQSIPTVKELFESSNYSRSRRKDRYFLTGRDPLLRGLCI